MPDPEPQAGPSPTVLVTAASGYIGSHVVPALGAAGFSVRVAARNPARLPKTVRQVVREVAVADALDADAVRASLEGIETAYYLVHTLGSGPDYAEKDRRAAEIFAAAAAQAGVKRIVFFGGLGADAPGLSEHLASRHEVGRVLGAGAVPVIEFRASIVLGSGSTSFEMIRNLVEKLPAMTTPLWVRQPSQPIAVSDVVAYLVAAASLPVEGAGHRVYEIGGSDVVTYSGLLEAYARHRGLKRLIIPVPVLSPGLSGWWLYLFTPKQATVGRQLAESLRFPTVVTNDAAKRDFPHIVPLTMEEAMRATFAEEDEAFSKIRWAEELAGSSHPATFEREGRYIDSRTLEADCPPEAAFDPIACIGGENGWYAFDTLWDIRGAFDRVLGGPGRHRGRRDQYALVEGDYLEWWRVQQVDSPRFLRLEAEMKLPGRGWLQYELSELPQGGTLVRQTAIFDAKGLLGRLYWYSIIPFHHFVFQGTLAGIEERCVALVSGPNTCPLPGEWERGVAKRLEGGER